MKKLKLYKNNTDGLLISFCGLDGCGKTTMIQRLCRDIGDSRKIFLTKQPTSAVRESVIFRTYMDMPDHSAYDYRGLSLLAASDRIQHTRHVIAPALEEGQIVISDRYFYSCLANLRARGYRHDNWVYEISGSIIRPDIAFFLDVPVETAVERVRRRPEEKDRYIDMDLQYRLRDEYRKICKSCGGVLIRSGGGEEDTYRNIQKNMERIWKKKYGDS